MRRVLSFSVSLALAAAEGGCFTNTPAPPGSTAVDGGGGPVANAGTVTIARDAGSPLSPMAFGQNYWNWVDWADAGTTGLTGTEKAVSALHLNVLRAGGYNNDANSPSLFSEAEIDKFVAYCRTVGAEPILQVPLLANNVDGGAATAQTAAAMVTYANVTKHYDIGYWEIGNEPDIYATNQTVPSTIRTAGDYCSAFASYATAMKAANAAAPAGGKPMRFVGPDLAYQYTGSTDWLTPFLDGCKDYVDVVAVHRYPYKGSATSIAGALTDVDAFRQTVQGLRAIVQGHARPGTPLAVTEANISYDYAPSAYTAGSVVAAPGTFYAALWTADAMGAALESNLWTFALWNLGEANSVGSVLGFITGGQPVPAYYAEQMVSANFRGAILSPAGVPSGFSVYASYDASAAVTSVLVLNKTTSTGRLALAIDTLAAQSFDFPGLSLVLVQIPDAANGATHVLRYTTDLATARMPPQVVQ